MSETRKVTVLLADDEKHVRAYVKALLALMNWEVVGEATHGGEAVALYQTLRPDVVLLDVNMPVKDGRVALKEIRAFDAGARVVMLSSMSDLETVQTAIALGAIHYVRMDTPVDELRSILVDTWQAHGRHEQGQEVS